LAKARPSRPNWKGASVANPLEVLDQKGPLACLLAACCGNYPKSTAEGRPLLLDVRFIGHWHGFRVDLTVYFKGGGWGNSREY